MITIKLETDNEAMQEAGEIARILRELADKISNETLLDDIEYHPLAIKDINGNSVGTIDFESEEE